MSGLLHYEPDTSLRSLFTPFIIPTVTNCAFHFQKTQFETECGINLICPASLLDHGIQPRCFYPCMAGCCTLYPFLKRGTRYNNQPNTKYKYNTTGYKIQPHRFDLKNGARQRFATQAGSAQHTHTARQTSLRVFLEPVRQKHVDAGSR